MAVSKLDDLNTLLAKLKAHLTEGQALAQEVVDAMTMLTGGQQVLAQVVQLAQQLHTGQLTNPAQQAPNEAQGPVSGLPPNQTV